MRESFAGDNFTKKQLINLNYRISGLLKHETPAEVRSNIDNIYTAPKNKSRVIQFGMVSDTHMGAKVQQLKSLHKFYDTLVDRGIKTVYHGGDISEGLYFKRASHGDDRFLHSFDQQMNYIVENYPKRDGIKTYFITGNHDYTHVMNGGVNIGPIINVYRSDMEYLGHNFAKIWLTPKVDMNVVHPMDGSAISISLKSQQRIDRGYGVKKCKIQALGHYHKWDYVYWNATHGITLPGFHGQSSFMDGKNLASIIGGVIVTLRVTEDGEFESMSTEFLPYEEIRGDY